MTEHHHRRPRFPYLAAALFVIGVSMIAYGLSLSPESAPAPAPQIVVKPAPVVINPAPTAPDQACNFQPLLELTSADGQREAFEIPEISAVAPNLGNYPSTVHAVLFVSGAQFGVRESVDTIIHAIKQAQCQ